MQTPNGLAIPVQIRQQQEALALRRAFVRRPEEHIFLLRPAFDDIEDPVQAALVAFTLHKRPDMAGVDLGGLGDEAHGLGCVFLDVGVGARVDEVDLEVGWLLDGVRGGRGRGGAGEVPAVDVVVAEILDVRERCWEGGEMRWVGWKGGALGEHQGWLGCDGALEYDTAAGLVWDCMLECMLFS